MSDSGQLSLPGRPADLPGLPENFRNLTWEVFETLNTKSPRPAISEKEMAWCDGFMPIGPSNLRTLYGIGAYLFSATGGQTVPWFDFGNIGDTGYCIILTSDGALHAQFTATTGGAVIAPPGTILTPSSVVGFSQWGSQYLIFAKDQENGYWLWDGANLFTAGTVGPEVTLDAPGSGYTSQPTITLATTGSGTGPTYSAQIENGLIAKITCTNPGSGFAVGDFAVLTIQGGGTDNQAICGTPTITTTTGGISEIYVTAAGQEYTGRAGVTVESGTGGSGATFSLSIQNGAITGAAVVTAGTGYDAAPILQVGDPGIPGSGGVPGGTGGAVACAVAFGQITAIPVIDGGSGYVSPPTVKIVGDGIGATAVANISGGVVTSITMLNNGSGYTVALAVLEGGNNAANATPTLMPFGISGTAVEIYSDRVWVTNGSASATFPPKNRTLFSDPNSPVLFSNGGGAFASTDSFLRVGYHDMKQSNGFLYLIGDSSLNYISGVTTTTPTGNAVGSATTTFNNVNVDPQFGSPWPSSVQVFSRNIVFANTVGIFVSYGGAVTKASIPLDGFYTSGPIYGATANYPAAVAHIFGIPVYMLLLPVIDQQTQQLVNKLLMWDGKRWFTSQQDRSLTYIATQEINSVLTAWGTDGTNVFPLFGLPSTGFTKTVVSKLYSEPAYWTTKQGRGLTVVSQSYILDQDLTVSVDNEIAQGTGNAVVSFAPEAGDVTVVNGTPVAIPVLNNLGHTVAVGSPGLSVFGPNPMGQQGRMIGLTVSTTASDVALLSLSLSEMVETVDVF